MSEQEFESYLGLLSRFLRLDARQRDNIRRELRAHLEEAIDEQVADGVPREIAIQNALEDFGDAAELAARFSKIGWQKRWIMRGTAVAASIGIVALWSVFSGNEPGARVIAQDASANRTSLHDTADRARGIPLGENAIDEQRLTIDFKDIGFSDAISYLAEQTDNNFHVFWQELEQNGIDRDQPISMSLRNVTLDQTLDLLLREASVDVPISYSIKNGIVLISTRSLQVSPSLETRFYEVRDLIPDWEPNLMTNPRNAEAKNYKHHMQVITDAIHRFVVPDSWLVNGGHGDISDVHGVLLIRQTPDVHRKVVLMLERMRELQPILSDNNGQQSAALGVNYAGR